jgi:fluoride ion exporter CrcB/FEX
MIYNPLGRFGGNIAGRFLGRILTVSFLEVGFPASRVNFVIEVGVCYGFTR